MLSVRDHDPGLTDSERERVFERYEHVGYGDVGLGLGLYLSRELTHAHGGSIEVESEPGRGSTFTLRLPRERIADTLIATS